MRIPAFASYFGYHGIDGSAFQHTLKAIRIILARLRSMTIYPCQQLPWERRLLLRVTELAAVIKS